MLKRMSLRGKKKRDGKTTSRTERGDEQCRVDVERPSGHLPTLFRRKSSKFFSSFIDAVKSSSTSPETPPTPSRVSLSAKHYASSLPQELILLIIRYATLPCPHSPFFSYLSSSTSSRIPVSFLTFPDHLHHLPSYQTSLSYKASLALVCRAWTPSALEVLYHSIWIFRAKLARKLAQSLLDSQSQAGSYIRALHIETSVMERAHPADMAVIVGCAKGLEVYQDVRSIRRAGMRFLVLDAPPITATSSSSSSLPPRGLLDGDKGTEDMLSLLPPTLRRLSWTNYEHDERDYKHGIRFYNAVVGPQLERAAAGLEFLELSLSAGPGPISHMLTELNLGLTSTTISTTCPLSTIPYTSTSSPPLLLPALLSLKVTLDNATFSVLSTWAMPALQNLSVLSADFSYTGEGFAAFFEVHGDKLRQLELGHSTGAIEDFWLTAPRTASSVPPLSTGGGGIGQFPLAEWCPNLEEFICSADAEWNWQSPDWIAPHVLLPTHPGLKFIGVRDMEKRIRDDLEAAEGRRLWDDGEEQEQQEEDPLFMLLQQFGSLLRSEAFPSLLYVRDMSGVSGFMRRVGRVPAMASSSLLSMDSDAPSTHQLSTSASTSSMSIWRPTNFLPRTRPTSSSSSSKAKKAERMRLMKEERDGRRVLKFWKNVLERCKERGVWLEDWEGVSVTLGDLRRAEGGAAV